MGVLKAIGVRVIASLFNLYVALNMLLCAVLFAPWSKPRETTSGFIGRQVLFEQNKLALPFAYAIDWLTRDRGHCGDTAFAEAEAYDHLYPEQERAPAPEQESGDGSEEHF